MKHINNRGAQRAFALPTVMIASVVMLMVLMSGLVASSSVNASLRQQYEERILGEAAESGRTMVLACLQTNSTDAAWQVLYPNSACSSTANTNLCPQPGAPAGCYILNTPTLKSSFTVGPVTTDANGIRSFNVSSTIYKFRSSSATIATQKTSSINVKVESSDWKDLVLIGGGTAACAISQQDEIYCWGDNTYGQLGDGTNVSRQESKIISGNRKYKSITTSGSGVCAIATTDYAYCWGRNGDGFLGTGNGSSTNLPTLVQAGENPTGRWQKIRMFSYSACGLSTQAGGYIYCWGTNYNYVLGTTAVALNAIRYTPVLASGSNYVDVEGGSHHVCGSAVGNIWCWGLRVNSAAAWYCDVSGEPDPAASNCPNLGARGYAQTTENTTVSTSGVVEIKSGSDTVCIRNSGGTTYCFGANFLGHAGDAGYGPNAGYATNGNRSVPYQCVLRISPSTACMSFKSITAGTYGFCGIDQVDEAWCWGLGSFGQHGDGTVGGVTTDPIGGHVNDGASHTVMGTPATIASTFAVKVSGTNKFKKLFGLQWGYCGMNFSNKLLCWGRAKNAIFGVQDGVARYYLSPTLAPDALRAPAQSYQF